MHLSFREFDLQLFVLFVSSLSSNDLPTMASCRLKTTKHLSGEGTDCLTRQVSREAGRTDLSFEDGLHLNEHPSYTLTQTPLLFSANVTGSNRSWAVGPG